MTNFDGQIIRPNTIIVPSCKVTPGERAQEEIGSLIMSGAKLYVCVSAGTFELVTSS